MTASPSSAPSIADLSIPPKTLIACSDSTDMTGTVQRRVRKKIATEVFILKYSVLILILALLLTFTFSCKGNDGTSDASSDAVTTVGDSVTSPSDEDSEDEDEDEITTEAPEESTSITWSEFF